MAISNKNNQQIIREYIINEKVGVGSYGVVYKVHKKGEKQFYVLKQISLFNLNINQIEEVKNESKILSQLNSGYITKYFDSFIENNNLNIVMEYCDGGDLNRYLNIFSKNGKALSEDRIWKFFIQTSLGLAYIHSKKILHRDLKTLNIFLTKDEKVKIGDLGVAKVLNQTNFARTFVGTPYYLSPEICEEKPYNEKSDIWALGCILYEMATYRHPFNATNQGALILKILRGKYDPISNKDYSADLRKMVDILLEKNHFKRPAMNEIIKNPIFIAKAKSLNMLELVVNCSAETNIYIEYNIQKEFSNEVNVNKRISPSPIPTEKKKSAEIISGVKNIKIEFNHNEIKKNINLIEDPSKKFIQMNLPHNYKKQLQNKKDKKDVKQAIVNNNQNGNNNNFNIGALLNLNANNPNNPLIPAQKDKRIPVKLIPAKKESGGNFNKQKIKELNQKINEFDLNLNNVKLNSKEKPFTPNENNKQIQPSLNIVNYKRPLTGSEVNNSISKKKKEKNKSHSQCLDETEACNSDELEKYKINKKLIQEKFNNNPDLKMIEEAVILPKYSNIFLNDNKSSTRFIKDLIRNDSEYNNIVNQNNIYLENTKYENLDINNFVNDLNKKSSSGLSSESEYNKNKNISISEFMVNNKIQYNDQFVEEKIKFSQFSKFGLTPQTNKICPANIRIKKSAVEPVENTDKDLNFQVFTHDQSSKDESTTVNYTVEKHASDSSACINSSFEMDSDLESDDKDEEEVVEDVSVIRDKNEEKVREANINIRINANVKESNDSEQNLKELIDLKEKFLKKIAGYKEDCKKITGDKDFDKIFQYYSSFQESEELSDKIENFIRQNIPNNYFNFIQIFYNLIYYEVQLGNVEKEIENKQQLKN